MYWVQHGTSWLAALGSFLDPDGIMEEILKGDFKRDMEGGLFNFLNLDTQFRRTS